MSESDLALDPLTATLDDLDSPTLNTLITSLRASLQAARVEGESASRQISSLTDVKLAHAELQDQHKFITAAKEAVEKQLKDESKKREIAEEQVVDLKGQVDNLRGQVDNARRGVMALQTERKRYSLIGAPGAPGAGGITGLGLGGLGEEEEVLSEASAGASTSKLVKRQSILRTHKRMSSQSEPDMSSGTSTSNSNSNNNSAPSAASGSTALPSSSTLTFSPHLGSAGPGGGGGGGSSNTALPSSTSSAPRTGLRELKLSTNPPSTSVLPTVPQPPPPMLSPSHAPGSNFDDTTSVSSLSPRKNPPGGGGGEEMARLRAEIQRLEGHLVESEEARMASENCLRALREFIALSPGGGGTYDPDTAGNGASADHLLGGGGGGGKAIDLNEADLVGIRLPPLPTDRDPDEDVRLSSVPIPSSADGQKKGWGFKLWKGQGQGQGQGAPPLLSPSPAGQEPAAVPPGLLSPNASIRSLHSNSKLTPDSEYPPQASSTANTGTGTGAAAGLGLSGFVNSWTKSVSPGTPDPKPSASPGTPATLANARGLSGFFSRQKEKDLPVPPSEAEGEREADRSLEPSPEIVSRAIWSDADADAEEEQANGESGDADIERTAETSEPASRRGSAEAAQETDAKAAE